MNLPSLPAAGLLAASLAVPVHADQPVYRIVRVITPVCILSTPGSSPIIMVRAAKVTKAVRIPTKVAIRVSAH